MQVDHPHHSMLQTSYRTSLRNGPQSSCHVICGLGEQFQQVAVESRVQKIEEDMGGDEPKAVLLVQPFKELNRERCALTMWV